MPTRKSGSPPRVAIQFGAGGAAMAETDALILAVPPGKNHWSGPLAEVDAALGGALRQALDDASFDGGLGKTHVIHTLGRLPARRLVLTGLPSDTSRADDVRRAFGAAATAAKSAGARNAASPAPGGGLVEAARYRAATEGVLLALYDFRDYKFENGDTRSIDTWTFLAPDTDGARAGVQSGFALAAGVYLTRDLINEPGQTLYPESFAHVAADVAGQNGLEYQEYDEQQLREMGATSICDVGKGSVHPPRLIHLTYRPATESRGTVAFVGKGITFDTGGMNLKPTGGIETMKTDMAGAAAVLGAMQALPAIGLPFTVHGIIAAAENMPSGSAYRPGDVLTAMNGKTMEITSTDAEGRLVLADALVYAARNGAEEMIDLATLTSAKVIGLGSQSVAVFSNDDDLAKRVIAAGTEAGDLFWHMPLWDELKNQIESGIADMKNSGGRGSPGGAITAALLLAEFTEGMPWVHLDIAGAAWTDSARDYTPRGPVGIGVRALVNYLEAKARG